MQQHFVFTEESRADWRIDDHTRDVGRLGIASARAALQACRPVPSESVFQHAA